MKQAVIFLSFFALVTGVYAQDTTKIYDTVKKFSQNLSEVTVTAKRPMMVQAADKTIVDVRAMPGTAALNTIELLERIPGVNVSSSGEISLNGKQGVMVMIDGKVTYMSAQDLMAYLKSIPAGNLDKVELIDNPSAKYDAAGNAIINIKFRKDRAAGLNGNLSSGASRGRYFGTNNSVNLNYNRKKLNLFANLGVSTFKEYDKDDFDRKFFNPDNSLSSNIFLQNDLILNNRNINIYAGFDYSLSKKSSIGANLNINRGRRDNDFTFISRSFDGTGKPGDISAGSTNGVSTRNNVNASLNYLLQLNKDGHELSADVNMLRYRSDGDRQQIARVYEANDSLLSSDLFKYVVPIYSDIIVFRADYARPFKNNTRLETGIKSSMISNDNVSEYFNTETSPVFVPGNSNHFRYEENINAAYFNLQKKWSRWQGQVGLRVEHLEAKGNQLGNESVPESEFKKSNTELFPSLNVTYKLDTLNKNSLSIVALRRISRPNYQQLNPFLFVQDEYTSVAGNPDLNPQFQYRLEARFQHKQLYWFQFSYNKFNQLVFGSTKVIDEKYVNRPENIGSGFMILLSSGLNVSPSKWLTSNNTLRIARLGVKGNIYERQLTPRLYAIRFETTNFFTISKNISADLNAYFASKDIIGQAFAKPMYKVSGGISKKFWNEKGSLRVGMDDIFHSWQYRNTSIALNQASFYETHVMDTRRINASFSYRFGKDARSRRRGGANDEEKGRLD